MTRAQIRPHPVPRATLRDIAETDALGRPHAPWQARHVAAPVGHPDPLPAPWRRPGALAWAWCHVAAAVLGVGIAAVRMRWGL